MGVLLSVRTRRPPAIPCGLLPEVKALIEQYARELCAAAPTIGSHGMTTTEFAESGLLAAAVERLRGQRSATMARKRRFVGMVLDAMEARGAIKGWRSAEHTDRHDLSIVLPNGRVAAVEARGCLDGNNTNIYQRPASAEEFLLWSLCQNPGADMDKNVWSGIHTRLGANIISERDVVDGLIVWDMLCGTPLRPCPKVQADPGRTTEFADGAVVPPPCLYLFPSTVPDIRTNARPRCHELGELGFMQALYDTFGCRPDDVHLVSFEIRVGPKSMQTERRTTITHCGKSFESGWAEVKRRLR